MQYKVPCLFVRVFVGRPRFVVYPPRPICHHDYLYVFYYVDHNLWSTLLAFIVSPRLIFLSTPMYFAGRLYFVVYPPHVYCVTTLLLRKNLGRP